MSDLDDLEEIADNTAWGGSRGVKPPTPKGVKAGRIYKERALVHSARRIFDRRRGKPRPLTMPDTSRLPKATA